MIYLISCLFTLFFVYYSRYQFRDLKTVRNTNWKAWGVLMRVTIFAGGFLLQLFPSPWQDYLLAGGINILLFEIGINTIALGGPVFWRGYSSKIDNIFGQYKWYIYGLFLAVTLFIRLKFN